MPIYMDRHDLPGVTAKDVAEAHHEDVKIEKQYGCRALTYWFDEKRGTAFCLIEAPDQESVKAMHDQAHGLVPHQLIEVDSNLVEAFLGRIEHPQAADQSGHADLVVFDEPAFRTIMAISFISGSLFNATPGDTKAIQRSDNYRNLIYKTLKLYKGSEVEHRDNGFLASFVSVSQAVQCAIDIQEALKQGDHYAASKYWVQIGISAGLPVTDSKGLFEDTVQLAKRLSSVAGKDKVFVSSVVRNLCKKEGLNVSGKESIIKTLSPGDEKFLNQLMDLTEEVWHEAEFNIPDLARQLGVSKSQLYRKTTALTGFAPNDFIKEYKLNKAVRLIEKQEGNISEIAYQTGFASPSYFCKCFQKRFHILPSEYALAVTQPFS